MKRARYTAVRDAASGRFPWIVVDATSGEPLQRKDRKIGTAPLRFRSQAAAEAPAARLNADDGK